jgi:PAS domain S-box-containing protein
MEDSPIRIEPILEGRNKLMLKKMNKSLTLKGMVFITFLTFLLLILACLSILQICPEDLKKSFIEVRGIILILGIPFSFFLTRKFVPSNKRLSKETEQELVQRTRELETIYEMAALISQNLGNADAVFPVALEKVARLTGYEMGAIFLLNESGDVLEMKFQIGHSPVMLEEVKVLKFNEGVSGNAIRLKQPVIVSIREYPSPRIAPILREEGIQTVVGIPLLAKGKAIGAIILSSRSSRKLSQKEIDSLESIGNHIGIALENAKLFSTIAKAKSEWETTFDAVTDLVTIFDKDYRIIRANKAVFKRFGLKPGEILGKRCFEILYHGVQPCEGCYVSETIKTKRRTSGERDSKYLNGVFQHDTFPIYDEEGEVIAVADLAREITEEKRMQMEKEVVNHVNKILASSLDVKQGIQSVYAELKRILDCERMTVALFDQDRDGFRYFAMEKDYEAGELVGNVLYPWKGTHFEKIAETGLPETIDNAEGDSWIGQKLLQEEGIRSTLLFPLENKGKIIGTVNFGSSKPSHFSEAQFNLLRQIAPGLAIFIQNALLFEEIKKSEEKYRTVVESAIDGVCVIGRDYVFKYVNERLAEIQGYTREELIGEDFRNFMDEDSKALLADREDKRARGIKLPPHFELNIRHKDGGIRNAEISTSAIKDSKGDVNIIVFLKDITDHKQAEEALRQSEEEARRLSEENAVIAEIGRIVSSTLNIEEVYERLAEEIRKLIPFERIVINTIDVESGTFINVYMAGKGIADRIVGKIYPLEGSGNAEMVRTKSTLLVQTEDFNEYKDRFPMLASTFEAGFQSIMNVPLFSKGRIIGGLLLRSLKPNANTKRDARLAERVGNQIAGAIAIARLFIDQKQAEEALRENENRLQALLDASPVGISWADVEGNIKYTNRKFCQLFGYTVDDIPTITEWRRLAYPDPAYREKIPSLVARLTDAQKQEREVRPIEMTITCKDGSTRYVEQMGTFVSNRILAIYNDLTERKKAEEALREREEQYRTLLETMEEGYYEVDLKGRFTFFNEALSKMHAFSKEEMLGMSNKQYMDEATSNKVYKIFNHVYKTGQPGKVFEWEIERSDGKKAVVESSVYLIRNAKGEPVGFRGITRDITERKRMEDALRESENKFRSLVEHSIVGVYLIQDGVFKYVNSRFAQIHGYEIEEMVGKMGPKQTTFPEDLSIVGRNIGKRMESQEESTHYEFRIVTKRQEIRSVEVFGSRTMYQGRPAVIGTMLDITDRKKAGEALRESEERYRNILESIEDGYYEVDLAGSLTFFNDSLCRIYGYPKEELIGMKYRQLTDQEDAKKLFQTFKRVYTTGEPGKVFDWEIVRKDGSKRHVEASVSLQKDTLEKAIGFRGILRDITERKKVEEQLFQAEKLRAVGEMASGVAHDFNNALAAILGNTQLLLHTAQDEELKETLKIIEKVAKDSGQTIRRLQDFTKKRVDQELFKVDVNAIVKNSIEMTKPKWRDEPQSRSICIEIVSNLEEIPSVSGNASELREVITNMIFNAIEAMPEGGKVEIRTYKDGKDVLIQISDTGTGISEEMKKRIFEPFFTTKPFTNTGLGLSMSYGIIKRFGGEIEIKSKLGQGTTFTIILPIGGEEKEEAVSPQTIKKGRQALILVIDDDEFVRSVLSRTLAQANHQVTLAENGEQGVQIFREGKFDIVLTDLGLPGISGWEVCRMIKEISPQTPVGMITGWGVEKNRSEMEEYGLDFFVSKPFDFNQILNVVAETMASKEE